MIKFAFRLVGTVFALVTGLLTVFAYVTPPEHRADWLMTSYVRYANQVAARSAQQAPPSFRATDEPMSCPGITLTQGYGPTSFVGEPVINGVRTHTGWDLACPEGTPVYSATGGIARVTYGYGGGFGNNVQVQTGNLWVRYGHLEVIRVRDRQVIQIGTSVGLEGSTGFSTGPHLHFEVDRGCPTVYCSIDPGNLISLPSGARR